MNKTHFLAFFLSFALLACVKESDESNLLIPPEKPGKDEPELIARRDIELRADEQLLPGETNAFAFNLLKTVYTYELPHTNILLSPLSANLAFLMLNNGAAGTTQEDIQQTLGYGSASRETINTYTQKIIDAMQTLDPRGVFESANSIWIKKDFPVINTFKQMNQEYYDAEIQNVDFGNLATLNLINDWVNEKTHEKIPKILDELPDPLTRLILINALYFKGYWTEPFNKSLTSDAVFHASDGSEQTVPTMRKTSITSHYAKLENSAAVELPFGNGAFSLVVVLPDEEAGISSVVEQIDAGWWAQVVRELSRGGYKVEITIPRFKVEYDRLLKQDLMALGMQTPFGGEADFSLISELPLWVSGVIQKTFAQMDEEGMEAAAVTAIMTDTSPGIDFTPVEFKADRPFLYFIKEKSTGLVFFTGVMNKIQ